MVAISCYSKAEKPEIASAISRKEDPEKISLLLFPTPSTGHRDYQRDFTKLIVKYLTSNLEKQKEMISNKEIRIDFGREIADDCMEKINHTLSLFTQ